MEREVNALINFFLLLLRTRKIFPGKKTILDPILFVTLSEEAGLNTGGMELYLLMHYTVELHLCKFLPGQCLLFLAGNKQ